MHIKLKINGAKKGDNVIDYLTYLITQDSCERICQEVEIFPYSPKELRDHIRKNAYIEYKEDRYIYRVDKF